jgi:membrane-associated phospholipid phosphatase
MMTVIAKQYDKLWIKIPAYALSVSVALQRIEDRQHWASDVIVGAALGYWVGSSLVNHNKKRTPSLTIEPYVQSNRFGLQVRF